MPRKSYQNGLPIKPRVCCMQYYVNYNTIAIGWAIIWATVYRTGLPWNGHRLNQWASTQSVKLNLQSVGIDPIHVKTSLWDQLQKATQSRRRRKEATSTTSRRQEQQIMPSSLWPSTSHRRMHTSTFVPSLDDFINVNWFSSSEHNKYLNLASHRRIATEKIPMDGINLLGIDPNPGPL